MSGNLIKALSDYYRARLERHPARSWDAVKLGDIYPLGWLPQQISYFIHLNDAGEIVEIESTELIMTDEKGKKQKTVPLYAMPINLGRTGGNHPLFLWDTSSYLFGKTDKVKKINEDEERFYLSREFHKKLLQNVDTPAAKAVIAFFDNWTPEKFQDHDEIKKHRKGIAAAGVQISFKYNSKPVTSDPEIRKAWEDYFFAGGDEQVYGTDVITGEQCVLAPKHMKVKLPHQKQESPLVSWNMSSFDCNTMAEMENAQIGLKTMCEYASALHYAHIYNEYKQYGDTFLLAWSENMDSASVRDDNMLLDLFGIAPTEESSQSDDAISHGSLTSIVESMGRGVELPDVAVSDSQKFYLLGIRRNIGRLVVRFFFENTFGELRANIERHNQLFGKKKDGKPFTAREIVVAVAKENSSEDIDWRLFDGITDSILFGQKYPLHLFGSILSRIEADRKIDADRFSILRAAAIDKGWAEPEVVSRSLTEETKNVPYMLGRAMALIAEVYAAAKSASAQEYTDAMEYFNAHYLVTIARNPRQFGAVAKKYSFYIKRSSGKAEQFRKLYDELQVLPYIPMFTSIDKVSYYAGYQYQREKKGK